MSTEWNLIRNLMAAVIDSCEAIEVSGYGEADRDLVVESAGHRVSLHDFMVSAWTLPETLRHQIIRGRHDSGADAPYVSDSARAVMRMAEACSELIGAGESRPADLQARAAIEWYRQCAVPAVQRAVAARRAAAGEDVP